VAGAGLVCWDDLEGSEGQTGGTCGNVLANLAYLGAKARLFDRLDKSRGAGQMILADLASFGVDLRWAEMFPSDNAPVLHRWLGKREGYRWDDKQVPLEPMQITGLGGKLSASRIFFFDRANKATILLAKHYREWGDDVYFVPQGTDGEFEAALDLATIVQFSAAYFPKVEWIAPKATIEVRTEGKKGLGWRLGAKTGHLSAKRTKVVDTAGAGDWLAAGLMAELHHQGFDGMERPEKLVAALRYGQALAALNCEYAGARGMVYELARAELAQRLGIKLAGRKKAQELAIEAF